MTTPNRTSAEIAARIGATEEEVCQVLDDPDNLYGIMCDRHLSEDAAVFLLIANAQAQ